jgi:ribonuclease P protein subunit RPR2
MPTPKKEIARDRVKILFELAEYELNRGNSERAKRYVRLARKIAMKAQEPIERGLKRKFCKKCNMLLVPGRTCSVLLNKSTKTVDIKCFNCSNIKRYPYKKNGRDRKETG